MLGYYLKLACKSFVRAPGITALMTVAIALGIGVCVATITVYHAMSGNPIWWKNGQLYAVTLDAWKRDQAYDPARPKQAPPQLGYRDATALFASPVPQRKLIMYSQSLVVSGGDTHAAPSQELVRVTTPDFFAMFEVPFLYGSPWSAQADQAAQPLVVLSRQENDKLFSGKNSVGRRVRIGERDFQVAGVLDRWKPMPRFYDVNWGSFAEPEDLYIPFGMTQVLQQLPGGGVSACWDEDHPYSFKEFLAAECVWLQMWVELPDTASRERMQVFIDQYWAGQRAAGRFPRPRNNHLTTVGDWLATQGVVSNDSRILVALACAFLAVCLINSAGLLLARFLGASTVTGLRRALGASRRQIFVQHLVEVALIAAAGTLLGLAVADVTLTLLHARVARLHPGAGGYADLWRFDIVSIYWAIALALISTLAAGLYPAWRIGRLPPARYLKVQ